MSCLKLQAGTLKQCLNKEGHPGDCIFTLLQPEVAAKEDRRKARDNQLVRRNLADGYLKAACANPSIVTTNGQRDQIVDAALAMADDLIEKTGGFGP